MNDRRDAIDIKCGGGPLLNHEIATRICQQSNLVFSGGYGEDRQSILIFLNGVVAGQVDPDGSIFGRRIFDDGSTAVEKCAGEHDFLTLAGEVKERLKRQTLHDGCHRIDSNPLFLVNILCRRDEPKQSVGLLVSRDGSVGLRYETETAIGHSMFHSSGGKKLQWSHARACGRAGGWKALSERLFQLFLSHNHEISGHGLMSVKTDVSDFVRNIHQMRKNGAIDIERLPTHRM